MTKPYSELVAQADAAVANVKDAELRRVAFGKILDDLLGSAHKSDSTPKNLTKRTPAPSKARAAKGSRQGGPLAYIKELLTEGFFQKPKTIAQVKAELENRGHHIPLTSLSGPMQATCQKRLLRRHKIKAEGGKQTFNYSNW